MSIYCEVCGECIDESEIRFDVGVRVAVVSCYTSDAVRDQSWLRTMCRGCADRAFYVLQRATEAAWRRIEKETEK